MLLSEKQGQRAAAKHSDRAAPILPMVGRRTEWATVKRVGTGGIRNVAGPAEIF